MIAPVDKVLLNDALDRMPLYELKPVQVGE